MKKLLLAIAIVCALALSAQASELEKAMEQLGDSFKPLATMAKTGKIDFERATGLVDTCVSATEKAAKIVPKTAGKEADPAAAGKAYGELQEQMLKEFQDLKAAITAKDEAAFKSGLEKLTQTRKKGHERFKKD
jgi:hypothetical protein